VHSLDAFQAKCETVKSLTFAISKLIDDLDIEQVTKHLNDRQQVLEALAQDVKIHQSDEYRTLFVNLLTQVAEQDAIDQPRCELLRDEYKEKLTNQFKNNNAIKQYKSIK